MREAFYVHIMPRTTRHTIYIGMTKSLLAGVQRHRRRENRRFSAQYHTLHVIHYEGFHDDRDAIARETQIKKWRREKRDWLIGRMNPQWDDLSAEIVEQLPKFDDPLGRPAQRRWPFSTPHSTPSEGFPTSSLLIGPRATSPREKAMARTPRGSAARRATSGRLR